MEDDSETKREVAETPEIVVAENNSEESIMPQNERDLAFDDKREQQKSASEEQSTSNKTSEFDVSTLDIESTLRKLDQKHNWLSTVEENIRNLEDDFVSKIQYVAISNHCQKYLDELDAGESVSQFQEEFSNLFDKFRKCFLASQQCLNKVLEVNTYKNMADAENRMLKEELEEKDKKINEINKNMYALDENLMQIEKEKVSLQIMLNELSSEKSDETQIGKEEIAKEDSKRKQTHRDDDETESKINELEEKIELLLKEIDFTKQAEVRYQNKIQKIEGNKESLQKELNSIKYDLQRQTTRAEKAEASIAENTADLKAKNATIKSLTNNSNLLQMDVDKSKNEFKRILKELRKSQKQLEESTKMIEKLKRDINIREDKLKLSMTQKESLVVDLNNKQMEVKNLKADVSNLTKEKNTLSRKMSLLEEKCATTETNFESSKKENAVLLKELDMIRKELEDSEGNAKNLSKQNDSLHKEAEKQSEIITELRNEIIIKQEHCRIVEKELGKSTLLSDNLKDEIKQLEKAKERLSKETTKLNQTIRELRNEIKSLELQFFEMKKTEAKLRQSLDNEQARYKLLDEDARHYQKLFNESKNEAEQHSSQEMALKKHIEQLQNYNQDLHEQREKFESKVKNITELLGDAKESQKQVAKDNEDLKTKLKRKDDQEHAFLKTVAEKEDMILTLRKKTKDLLEENNLQNSKLTAKDKEMRELKENIRLLQKELTTLDKSVNDKINDIKLLKLQIDQMNRSNALMNEQVEFLDDTRKELMVTQNKLMEEKGKSKVLEDEVQRPINLHRNNQSLAVKETSRRTQFYLETVAGRWRILEGIDPDRAQLVAKNQTLQKQLLKMTAELEKKEVEYQENERLTNDLQLRLCRRSQDSIEEQLWICKKELNARTERLKVTTSENNMFQNLCEKYKQEVWTLKNELRKYKMAEFSAKNTKNKPI